MARAATTPNYFRHHQFAGLVIICLGIFYAITLLSFNSIDPSFNNSTSGSVENWGGGFGAALSDLTLQISGLSGAAILVATMFAWGWRMVSEGAAITHKALRTSCMLVAIVACSVLLHYVTPSMSWPLSTGLGGAMGMLVHNGMANALPDFLIIIFALGIAVVTLPMALGLHATEWRSILDFFKRLGTYFVALGKFVWELCKGSGELVQSWPKMAWGSTDAPRAEAPKKKRSIKRMVKKDVHPEVTEKPKKTEEKVVSRSERSTSEKKQASLELRAKQGDYELPSVNMLKKTPKPKTPKLSDSSLKQNAKLLESVLEDFGVNGEIVNIRPGPVVTLYELEPSAGTKSARVVGLADDIARSMSAISARISVIPGRNAIGIELPNQNRETVYMRGLLEDDLFSDTKCNLPMVLGKDIGGDPIIADLARMPHLLVAGTTGSGKSVAINTMIASLLYHYSPDQCKFIMIDPKMLELSIYDGIPHLLSPVVTEPGKAVVALKWAVKEMENRYRLMANLGVRNVDGYNARLKEARNNDESLTRNVQTGFNPDTGKPIYEEQEIDMNPLPFIVVIVDEMADLMLVAGKDIEASIQRLAQMARAAGIHIIMATQRPSVDVITGVIKANFPTRISFQVTSKIDSRTILGEQGAEQLLGMGDMLYMEGGGRITRVHGPFMSDDEVGKLVDYLKTQGEPEYVESVTVDEEQDGGMFEEEEESDADRELYDRAVAIVARDGKASTSYIQRCLKIGYNRAARLIEKMEREGVVGPANHVGKREILLRGEGE